MQRLTDAEILQLHHQHQSGEIWAVIARHIGYSGTRLGDLVSKRMQKITAGTPSPTQAIGTTIADLRAKVTKDQQIATLKHLTSKHMIIQDLITAIQGATAAITPASLIVSHVQPPEEEEVLVLFLSDVHVGQHTPARINGGWTQDLPTTIGQFQVLAQQIIHRQTIHPHWRTLQIIDMGDDVEGSSMRVSQTRIVDPLVAQQAVEYGKLLATFINQMLQYFSSVVVDRIPGNHGRVSSKAGNSGLDELDPINSWDWVGGEVARGLLTEAIAQNRVQITNHEGFYGVTEILGHLTIFEHGASLKGGGSFGGIPWYGVERMAAQYRDLEGPFRILGIGHWHRAWDSPSGYNGRVIANGAFPPTTPYVVSNKHQATRPCQVIVTVGKTTGTKTVEWLYLDTPRIARYKSKRSSS